jgi:hypothetical protein
MASLFADCYALKFMRNFSIDGKLSADDKLWSLAVKRETTLRTFLQKKTMKAEAVQACCRDLGVNG